VLHLTQPYASTWYTYNQLAEITPMPMAWDVTKIGGAPGSGGCHTSPANCKAVFNFLTAQSEATSSYVSSPIWSVVDGPWKLQSFSPTGADEFVPNPKYSGNPKPTLSALMYVPYTTDAAQYAALKSGSLDVGYVPPADLPQKPASAVIPTPNPLGSGYNLEPFYSFEISYFVINYKNPTYGPVFSQLYFRQALMYVNDQVDVSKSVYRGYGYPTTGAVPIKPPNAYLPAVQTANGGAGPYAFNIAKARSLLTSHGWKMISGVMTCEIPAKCGAGIKTGTQAKFTMDYSSGSSTLAAQSQVYKSNASQAGIDITLVGETFNTVISKDNSANPNWTIADFSGNVYNGPGFLPTGESLYGTGGGANPGSYSDPAMNKLIKEVEVNSSPSAFQNYATFAAEQLPSIWMPSSYLVQAVKSNLHGVTFNPLYTFLPEYWYFTK
jgi:peptide/nickel transport system substrate-binding protein